MVRDRLFNNQTDTDHEERTTMMGNRKSSAEMKRLKKFMVPHLPPSGQQSQTSDSDTAMTASSPPIADLYNDTTIMFADIAGFTAWSSEREPTQVFQLLESLFCEFDSEAKAMKVFKIETVRIHLMCMFLTAFVVAYKYIPRFLTSDRGLLRCCYWSARA